MNDDERVFDALIEEIEDDAADNVRKHIDEREDTALALSVQALGFQVPVILTAGESKPYRLADGFRRLRTAKRLKKQSIRAIFRAERLNESEQLHRQIVINEQRQHLLPREKARGIAGLMEAMGWNASEAARQLGMSPAGVSRSLALLKAPPEVQQAIDEGRIAGSTANDILAEKDPQRQLQLVRHAASRPLTREAVAAKRLAVANSTKTSSSLSRAKADLGGGASVTVAATDLTLESFIACLKVGLANASKARTKGLDLGAFLKLLRAQAKENLS